MTANLQNLPSLLNNPAPALQANAERWEGYLTKILRKDMKPEYDLSLIHILQKSSLLWKPSVAMRW